MSEKSKGIGGGIAILVVAGLALWALMRGKPAGAAPTVPTEPTGPTTGEVQFAYYACYPGVERFKTKAELDAATHLLPAAGVVSVILPAKAQSGTTIPIEMDVLLARIPLITQVYPKYQTSPCDRLTISVGIVFKGALGVYGEQLWQKTAPIGGVWGLSWGPEEFPPALPSVPTRVKLTLYMKLESKDYGPGFGYYPPQPTTDIPPGIYQLTFTMIATQGGTRYEIASPSSVAQSFHIDLEIV